MEEAQPHPHTHAVIFTTPIDNVDLVNKKVYNRDKVEEMLVDKDSKMRVIDRENIRGGKDLMLKPYQMKPSKHLLVRGPLDYYILKIDLLNGEE